MEAKGQPQEPALEAAVAMLPVPVLALDAASHVALARRRSQASMGWPEALAALAEGRQQGPGFEEAWRSARRVAGQPGLSPTEALAMAIAKVGRPGSWRAARFDLCRSPIFLRDEWAFSTFLKALRAFGEAQRKAVQPK